MHPKKVLAKKTVFWAKLFLGALIFEISMKKLIFWYPIRPNQRKKSFHLIVGSVCTFYELKSPKMEATTPVFQKMVFYKQVLEFHCPSKLLCQTSGRQNRWSLLSTGGSLRRNLLSANPAQRSCRTGPPVYIIQAGTVSFLRSLAGRFGYSAELA